MLSNRSAWLSARWHWPVESHLKSRGYHFYFNSHLLVHLFSTLLLKRDGGCLDYCLIVNEAVYRTGVKLSVS